MNNNHLTEILISEIRENRAEIKAIRKTISKMDKQIFSNKIKLALFMGGFTLFFNIICVVIFEKVKQSIT